ncbi:hypothetical protein HDV06_002482 [Boothiomyces sp. JEL0866]|nr:hypothetical protein HDV06_002482 [Boothiomyces sp. JEL0866]
MSKLPIEIFLLVIENLSIKELWQYRRVSKWWKTQLEMGMVNHIRYNPLVIDAYLLNASGGPWFTFTKSAIESLESSQLILKSCDFNTKLIEFEIEKELDFTCNWQDRLDWSVKCDISQPNSKGKLFTLIAPDTPLHGRHTLTTVDMLLYYEIIKDSESVKLKVERITCSFSFVFSRFYKSDLDYGNYSVFPSAKRDLIIQKAAEYGLVWKQNFWYSGVVLHWLSSGEMDEIDGVILFLLEHESFVK